MQTVPNIIYYPTWLPLRLFTVDALAMNRSIISIKHIIVNRTPNNRILINLCSTPQTMSIFYRSDQQRTFMFTCIYVLLVIYADFNVKNYISTRCAIYICSVRDPCVDVLLMHFQINVCSCTTESTIIMMRSTLCLIAAIYIWNKACIEYGEQCRRPCCCWCCCNTSETMLYNDGVTVILIGIMSC